MGEVGGGLGEQVIRDRGWLWEQDSDNDREMATRAEGSDARDSMRGDQGDRWRAWVRGRSRPKLRDG